MVAKLGGDGVHNNGGVPTSTLLLKYIFERRDQIPWTPLIHASNWTRELVRQLWSCGPCVLRGHAFHACLLVGICSPHVGLDTLICVGVIG